MKITLISDNNVIVDIHEEKKKILNQVIKEIIERCYNNASETEIIIVGKNEFIFFTKYLGLFISHDLSNESKFKERIKS